jgi:RNA polymerase sigma factor (TIGR02999 family)
MPPQPSATVTQTLEAIDHGDRAAAERLLPLVYDELRLMARRYLGRERIDHTLAPTALVHEAWMKLVEQTRVQWKGRAHFMGVAAQAMRRILVDHARERHRHKRGGGLARITLDEAIALAPGRDEDLLAVDEALERLAQLDARQARIVELRFFGGLDVAEVAEVLGVSKRTVEAEWTMLRAWLRRELGEGPPSGERA